MTTEFTPFASLAGGALIGLSAVGLLLASGRIAGIAGIIRRVLMPDAASRPLEAMLFIGGLFAAPAAFYAVTGEGVQQTVSNDIGLLIVAGFLVGFGSILGSGCTSGHGVCGLSRMSVRSIVATGTFMASAGITVYFMRHVLAGG
jgi:uncharacterized membrane protein YedE/YeeE